MKKLIAIFLMSGALTAAHAQLITPPAVSGALFGSIFGGLAGGNCQNGGFSGNGAAIGAGVGFVVGSILGQVEARNNYVYSQPAYYAPSVTYVQPGYGYVTTPAYTYAAPAPVTTTVVQQPAPVRTAPAAPTYQWTAQPVRVYQIPDAPRVPDAPTF
jgi:hypothetical protein